MLSDKQFEKVKKELGKDTRAELDALSADDLKIRIVSAESSVKIAVEELEENPKYQKAKEDLSALRRGLSEVKKRQKAIVLYSLHLLEEKGK